MKSSRQRQCRSKQPVQSEYEDSNFSPSLYMFTSFSDSAFYTKGVRYVEFYNLYSWSWKLFCFNFIDKAQAPNNPNIRCTKVGIRQGVKQIKHLTRYKTAVNIPNTIQYLFVRVWVRVGRGRGGPRTVRARSAWTAGAAATGATSVPCAGSCSQPATGARPSWHWGEASLC